MKVSRRGMMAGALAVPTVAGLASWRWQHGEHSVLLHDPALAAGQRFAAAGRAAGGEVRALDGDRVRLMHQVLRNRPALIAGISLSADALMAEEVAREAGYVRVAELDGNAGGCTVRMCRSGWQALGSLAGAAGANWAAALATYAAQPGAWQTAEEPPSSRYNTDAAIGWVLALSA